MSKRRVKPKCPECKKTLGEDFLGVLRCYNEKCSQDGLTANVPQPIDQPGRSVLMSSALRRPGRAKRRAAPKKRRVAPKKRTTKRRAAPKKRTAPKRRAAPKKR